MYHALDRKNRFKAKDVYRGKRKIGLSEKRYSDMRFFGEQVEIDFTYVHGIFEFILLLTNHARTWERICKKYRL